MTYIGNDIGNFWASEHFTEVRQIGGPERTNDADAADPAWKPRRVGFGPPPRSIDPLLWEGDNA